MEDYTEFLEAAGLWANPGPVPEGGEAEYPGGIAPQQIGMGVAGLTYAIHAAGPTIAKLVLGASPTGYTSTLTPLGTAAIGFGIGMIVQLPLRSQCA